MNYRLLLALLATAALALTSVRAQSDDEDDDQEFDYFAYFARAHNNLTFGFRATQGAKVKFGNLGSITAVSPDDTTSGAHVYNNGTVAVDPGPRTDELDSTNRLYDVVVNGVTVHHFQTIGVETFGDGSPVFDSQNQQVIQTKGDFLAYNAGYTRSYLFNSAAQLSADGSTVAMTQYTTIGNGAGFDAKRSLSGGVELRAERLFTEPAKRFRFSLVAGVALNGINSKKSGSVTSTLHILTDTYAFNGSLPSTATYPYNTSVQLGTVLINDSNGVPITVIKEIQPLLSANFTRLQTDVLDGAEVTGVWEVKGSYLVVRFGPEISASVTPSISFNASAGLAGAYVGTNYTAMESAILTDPTLVTATITSGTLTSETSKFLAGYYADLDANWAINERSGLFAGMSYEAFGDFNQTVAGRTAKVDLGGNASVRGGLSIKF